MDHENARRLVTRMVSALAAAGKEDFSQQLTGLRFDPIDTAGSFALEPESPPPAVEVRGVLSDAEARDLDDAQVFALLHAKDGRLFELEVYRGDGGPIRADLQDESFEITYPIL